jgi:hypothetical protein
LLRLPKRKNATELFLGIEIGKNRIKAVLAGPNGPERQLLNELGLQVATDGTVSF